MTNHLVISPKQGSLGELTLQSSDGKFQLTFPRVRVETLPEVLEIFSTQYESYVSALDKFNGDHPTPKVSQKLYPLV